MMRDIFKAKLLCCGYDLRDDGSLYKKGQLIARNVEVTSEGFDRIDFKLDILHEDPSMLFQIYSDLGIKLSPIKEHQWLH